ncbi:MAG: SLBB domain-containing protein [Treponemataceae bacterium]|nr:SLBB domain-containing protein [Treponemataceae bacterium]
MKKPISFIQFPAALLFLMFCMGAAGAQSSLYEFSGLQNANDFSNPGSTAQTQSSSPYSGTGSASQAQSGNLPQNNGTAGQAPQTLQDSAASAAKSGVAPEENLVVNAKLAMASKDYPVTAGDTYSLSFVVRNEIMTFAVPVDSSYQIKVANLAVINGRGKTFLELKKQVEEVVNKNYPLSGVQFFILQPSIFNIVVSGEVRMTTEKKAWALSRLSSVIADALTDDSSTRDIVVVSEDGTERSYDLFKAERDGDLRQDPYMRPGDRVVVGRSARKTTVFGAVKRPGRYDLLEGEGVQELVELYGGGLAESADVSRIEIYRTDGEYNSSGRKIYLSGLEGNYPLANSDSVYVSSYQDLRPVVFIEGSVAVNQENSNLVSSNRVIVPFDAGENYSFLVRRNKELFTASSDLEHAYINRKGAVILMDLREILYNDNYYAQENAEEYDVLVVPFKQSFVSVAGAVKTPGRYPYVPDRGWEYYIGLAGGFDKSMNSGEKITICDKDGNVYDKSEPIVPESTITAKTNSFMYHVKDALPIITTILTAISTTVTVMVAAGVFNK